MHRDLYYFGILFSGLYILATLFIGILFYQVGYQLYQLEAFANWFWIEVGLTFISAFIFLQYYKHKGYRLTYIATMISIIAALLHYIAAYLVLVLMMRELMTYYIITVAVSMLSSLFYGISLVVPKAGKNLWLLTEGIMLIVFCLASGFLFIWSLNLLGMQASANIEIFNQWLILLGSLIPVPMLILFYQEQKALPQVLEGHAKYKYADLLYASGGLLVLSGLIIAMQMSTQTYWRSYISPEEQALVNKFESKTFEGSDGKSLDYLLMKPLDYDSTQTYPLVICLHGGPQSAKSQRVLVTQPAPMLSKPENRKKYPAFLFVPQAPPALSWGGTPMVNAIDSLLIEAIQKLEESYAIDKKRIYLTGISMGGYGTWYLMGTRPEMFAAGIPMCGSGDPKMAPNMVGIPIWAFHGSDDRNVPVNGSRDMIAAIKAAGGDPRYTEFPDVAHHVWPHVEETDGVLKWLFAQERE